MIKPEKNGSIGADFAERNVTLKITKGSVKAIFPDLRGNLSIIRYPCFGEVKLDGEATAIIFNNTFPNPNIYSTNKYGTTRTEWSKLDEISEICEAKEIESGLFVAELYFGEGKAKALYDLLKNKDNDTLNLKIFDVSRLNYKDKSSMSPSAPLLDRKEIITDLFNNTEFLLPTKVFNSQEEVKDFFTDATDDGYEGIVVKNFDSRFISGPCDWVKMKNKDQSEYRVRSIDMSKERIEVEIPTPATPGTLQLIQRGVLCGVKVVNKYKKDLKIGDMVVIEHQGVLASGSLRHPVFIKKADSQNEGREEGE